MPGLIKEGSNFWCVHAKLCLASWRISVWLWSWSQTLNEKAVQLVWCLAGVTWHYSLSRNLLSTLSLKQRANINTLISFNSVSLFTSVPVIKACNIIKQQPIPDPNLDSRTALTHCLNSNSIRCCTNYFKQLTGAALSSSLSDHCYFLHGALPICTQNPWWAILTLAQISERHLCNLAKLPTDLHHFLDLINRKHSDIQFSMETYLDVTQSHSWV